MKCKTEIWKEIEGYEAIYEVSNLGRVRSLDRVDCAGKRLKGKILRNCAHKDGYMLVGLNKNGNKRKFTIHRLVAIAFIQNPCGYEQINHIDEIKYNNFDFNLEWCDSKYNMNYGTAQERRIKNTDFIAINKQGKKIYQYDKNNNLIEEFRSACEVKRRFGYDKSLIRKCCKGEAKTAYGFLWRYVAGGV